MKEFQKVFSATLRNHATNGTNPSSSGSATGHLAGASTYSDTSFTSRKRSLSGDGSTPPDDGDDSNKRRRPDSVSKGKQPISELRFACPYYKRNPGRHQTFTSCRDPGFTTVARLKEHLYRRHLLPPQCHRCCTTFTNDVALREHQRDPSGCELREQIPLEGFDKEQEKRMKSKKGSQMHHSEIEKWKAVYRILFPDDNDADMPSPYIEYKRNTANAAESSNSARFQEFSRLELPRLVRRTLESIVEHEAQPLEDRLKERLVDIVRQCQMQLETMFQTAARPSNTRVEGTLSSRAIMSEQIVERPIDAHLPTTLNDFVSTDLQTKPEVKPSQLQICEPSCQGGGVPEITDPISDSSDSGYDSISIAALSATGVHNELPQEHFDPNQYLDLNDYPHFPQVTAGTTVHSTQTDANDDHSMWFLVDNLPGTNYADSGDLDCVHGLDHVW
ncbi:hypothetical protein AA0111_g398 [Alternaria arborescens]|uniref:hypothetical protein n=1 Tax=Alternaria arborescens TaxID=156630 RepID=UPI0010757220|nr:hypothetical protein AA0111_g398 [Alternaria arborescens]RYO42753.1 hypothetical protein AA0111_g398 [Alternaria arborescens]